MRHLPTLLLGLGLLVGPAVLAQEVCNNAIDDDADGLVDLNDTTDCVCTGSIGGSGEVTSIIPNPSFEEFDCYPSSFSELNCASEWEQATDATSDYFLQGGFFPANVIPQPIPDGVACAGFIPMTTYKEYLGACLPNPLVAGEPYSFQMWIAGGSENGSLSENGGVFYGPLDIVVFGRPDCVPFPVPTYDCPEAFGWTPLGQISYQGINQWEQITIEFTPTVDINTVMIGPACTISSDFNYTNGFNPYFWVDDLTLNASALFQTGVTVEGSFCTDNVVLTAHPDSLSGDYQWFSEGVALIGQTDTVLDLAANGLGPGTYQFQLNVDTACAIGTITVAPPAPVAPLPYASDTLGCVPLFVDFSDLTENVDSCVWSFGDGVEAVGCDTSHLFTSPGTYDVTLTITTAEGCTYDTTIVDYIHVIAPPTAAFDATPQPTDISNTLIQFTDASSSDAITWQWWFDTIPPYTAIGPYQEVQYPAQPGTWPVTLVVTNAAGCIDTVRAFVTILPPSELEMPNVFSPNGDGSNDRFVPLEYYGAKARLTIYNRWGQEIFSTTDLVQGWNGRVNGKWASDGTYYWRVEPLASGLKIKQDHGHLTLLGSKP